MQSGGFSILKGKDNTEKVQLRRIGDWVKSALVDLHLDFKDAFEIMVTQAQCFDPGCVPIETLVILVPKYNISNNNDGSTIFLQRFAAKITKPCAEVTQADVSELDFLDKLRVDIETRKCEAMLRQTIDLFKLGESKIQLLENLQLFISKLNESIESELEDDNADEPSGEEGSNINQNSIQGNAVSSVSIVEGESDAISNSTTTQLPSETSFTTNSNSTNNDSNVTSASAILSPPIPVTMVSMKRVDNNYANNQATLPSVMTSKPFDQSEITTTTVVSVSTQVNNNDNGNSNINDIQYDNNVSNSDIVKTSAVMNSIDTKNSTNEAVSSANIAHNSSTSINNIISTPTTATTGNSSNNSINLLKAQNTMRAVNGQVMRDLGQTMIGNKTQKKTHTRRSGCPCCDPDNIDLIVDKMMF